MHFQMQGSKDIFVNIVPHVQDQKDIRVSLRLVSHRHCRKSECFDFRPVYCNKSPMKQFRYCFFSRQFVTLKIFASFVRQLTKELENFIVVRDCGRGYGKEDAVLI